MPDAARLGGPPDILKVLADVFEVPAGPFRSREDARNQVLVAAREAGVPEGARIFLSDDLVRRGALFDASGARVTFPDGDAYERCFVALVDPDPEARWGHPAHFAFVPAGAGAKTVLSPTSLPEHPGSSVRLLPLP